MKVLKYTLSSALTVLFICTSSFSQDIDLVNGNLQNNVIMFCEDDPSIVESAAKAAKEYNRKRMEIVKGLTINGQKKLKVS